MAKEPYHMAKEPYLYGKRGLFIWQKRPVHKAKEAYSYGKRGLSYGKRGLFIRQKRKHLLCQHRSGLTAVQCIPHPHIPCVEEKKEKKKKTVQ